MRRRLALTLVLVACLCAMAASQSTDHRATVDPWVLERTEGGAEAEFLVILRAQADLSGAARLTTKLAKGQFVFEALRHTAETTQPPLLARLRERGAPHRAFYIVNLVWVRGSRDLVDELALRDDVAQIDPNPVVNGIVGRVPEASPPDFAAASRPARAIEPNLMTINAPAVWALGFTGQGVVIGNQDTGFDWQHPALLPHYRGWNGSVASHDYNWHDSIHSGGGVCGANQPAPCDDYGHGTHTCGTTCGDDSLGNQIGVAPGAKWIGSRNMDQGNGTPATYLESFEFFLAPYPVGGVPAQGNPALAPDVTSNSWLCPPSEGCTTTSLLLAVQAQRAAGIVTVVAAGNDGSGCSTIYAPCALYDEVYSVGAHRWDTLALANFSSRGPVTIDGSGRIKPDIAAPGVNVRSCTPGGGYGSSSGTSMATPHVAGTVALLISAHPAIQGNVDAIEQVLNATATPVPAVTCGGTGSWTNEFGHGRLDALAAVQAVYTSTLATPAPFFAGPAGGSATATLTIQNTGFLADTYAIAVTGAYAATAPALVGPVAAGATAAFAVAVTIPGGAPISSMTNFNATATSQAYASSSSQTTFSVVVVTPTLTLSVAQPAGPGTGVVLNAGGQVPGNEMFLVFSFEPAPGGVGTGPYLGLWTSSLNTLLAQTLLPLGSPPFHYLATATAQAFGPFGAPPGFYLECIAVGLNAGALHGVSAVAGYTVL
jgi:serine protease AprX